jgi:hypothetical protein
MDGADITGGSDISASPTLVAGPRGASRDSETMWHGSYGVTMWWHIGLLKGTLVMETNVMANRPATRLWMHVGVDTALVAAVVCPTAGEFVPLWEAAIGIPMVAALLFRRYRPAIVMGTVTMLGLAQVGLGFGLNVYDIAIPIAMVTVVNHARLLQHAYSAGAAAWLFLTADFVVRRLAAGRHAWVEYLTLVAVLALGWGVSFFLRTQRTYRFVLEERARAASPAPHL